MYLTEQLGYDRVHGGLYSIMFDVGGIVGGPILGIVVDRFYGHRPLYGIYQVCPMQRIESSSKICLFTIYTVLIHVCTLHVLHCDFRQQLPF